MSTTLSPERTSNYFRQIKGSFVFKGLAILASFFAVPLLLRYLGAEQFGVWSTILSVMSWIVFFDLGIGNGLRNKVAEALAKDDAALASRYISSGYTLIGLISLCLFAITVCASFFIPWRVVFNTSGVTEVTLRSTVVIAAFFILLNFALSLIAQVLNAVQKTAAIVFGQFFTNALSLGLVYLLTRSADASLIYLSAAYGGALVSANVLLSIWFYRKRADLIPALALDTTHIRPLLSLGLQFFAIQLAVLVIFTTDKILITQLFGPQYVAQYDVVFKLFGCITIAQTIVTAPLWSSYTDAYHRGDFAWIRNALHKQLRIFGVVVGAVALLAVAAKPIIAIWIGREFEVSSALVGSMAAFIVVSTWNNIFAYFVNGIGEIKVQLYTALAAMALNIPLALFLVKVLGFGLNGIVLATTVSLTFAAVVLPLQVRKIVARGLLEAASSKA
ncbi:MAG: oligosaccharide flippase family protein [Massilia sp.]